MARMVTIINTPRDMEVTFGVLAEKLLASAPFDRGEVHAQKVTDPNMVTRELLYMRQMFNIPPTMEQLQKLISPNLPWAEDHFQERVGGEPLNPPPAEAWWPYAQQGNAQHKKGEKFSHTYPERFWPKEAGWDSDRSVIPHFGIRFEYGDLGDLIEVLKKNPRSRQAYLPVWFPEDLTAAREGERVPCTLGYHFLLMEDGTMDMTYNMRSCDLVRFFRDDVYMAGRLLQWVCRAVDVQPGIMVMNVANLHAFVGDDHLLQSKVLEVQQYGGLNLGALY